MKPARTFDETLNRLLAHGKRTWPKFCDEKNWINSCTCDCFLGLGFDSHTPLTGRLGCDVTNADGEKLELDLCFREIGNAC
jgi:hypothetical protein